MTKHKSESLADFFNSIGGEKKKLKEEKSKIIGDLSLDNLFSSMEEELSLIHISEPTRPY